VSVDNAGIVISAVKLADDAGDDPRGDVVVRVYEALGGRATGRLTFDFPAGSVVTTDLLERPLPGGSLDLQDGGLQLALRPFQVLTLRVTRPT
jgi:alpha-mannosidase